MAERRFVQISHQVVGQDPSDMCIILTAIADDGTAWMWQTGDKTWNKILDLPNTLSHYAKDKDE